MKNGSQTFRYKISYWFLFIGWGSACMLITVGTISNSYSDILLGNHGVLDYLFAFIISIFFFIFGLLSFLVPLTSKIVVSKHGIEYRTFTAIIEAKWDKLSIGTIQYPTGYSKTFICQNPAVTLRSWVKYLPWDVEKGIKEIGIPFSQFGGFKPNDLIEAINQYISNLQIKN